MKKKLLCGIMMAGIISLTACGQQIDYTNVDVPDIDTSEVVDTMTQAAEAIQEELPDSMKEEVETIKDSAEDGDMIAKLSEMIPAEELDALTALLANHEASLDNVDMDPVYKDFITGKTFYNYTFDGEADPTIISSYMQFYEGYGDFYKESTHYALVDVDNDGADELYYVAGNGDENLLSYIFDIKDGKLELLNMFESHTPRMSGYLTSQGIYIEEGFWQDSDDYYEAYSFTSDGKKELIEEIRAADFEDYDSYMEAVEAKMQEYENVDLLELNTLSEAVE